MEKTLEYWRKNADDGFMTTPISVLRYINELENRIDELETTEPVNIAVGGVIKLLKC